MFPLTSIQIIYRACSKWSENGGARLSAALSYYTLCSVAPLLLIAIHVSAAIFGDDAAHGKVHEQLQGIMGNAVARSIENMIDTANTQNESAWGMPALSIILLVVAALGAFVHVRGSLCIIWKIDPPRGNSWLGKLWDYALALIMVFITATLILGSLATSLVVPIVLRMMQESRVPVEVPYQRIEWAGSFVFLTALFAAVYRVLSGGRIPWGYVVYGAFITAVLFTIGKSLLSYYLVYSGIESMYGAAGSIVVFMMWVHYSSQILFFGAELIQARRTRHEWINGAEKPSNS